MFRKGIWIKQLATVRYFGMLWIKWPHIPNTLEGDAENRDEESDVELDDDVNTGANEREDGDVEANEDVGGDVDDSEHKGREDLTANGE